MVRISEVTEYWMEEDCPIIAIKGPWLLKLGFQIGQKVVVDASVGRIIIKAVDATE